MRRFIGLTPGVLVTVGMYRWLKGVFSGRKGVKQFARQGQLLLILRCVFLSIRLPIIVKMNKLTIPQKY